MPLSVTNPVKDQIASGNIAVGLGVRLSRGVEIAGLAVEAGYDWLFIDLEHGSISLETVSHISNTAILAGCAPIVRVPTLDFNMACRALDGGALGVIFPHVNTAEEAKAIVDHVRYPPIGRRSFAARQPIVGFAAKPAHEIMPAIDAQILTFAMIESREGVENAGDIAAVPGIDVLFIGAYDLTIDLGIADQFESPQFRSAVDKVVKAGRKNGKAVGIGGIRADEYMQSLLQAGVSIVLGDMETSLLIASGRAQTSGLRAMQAVAHV